MTDGQGQTIRKQCEYHFSALALKPLQTSQAFVKDDTIFNISAMIYRSQEPTQSHSELAQHNQ